MNFLSEKGMEKLDLITIKSENFKLSKLSSIKIF